MCAGSSLLPQNLMVDFSRNLRCPLSPHPGIPLVIDRGPGRWAVTARFHRPVLSAGPHGQPWPLTVKIKKTKVKCKSLSQHQLPAGPPCVPTPPQDRVQGCQDCLHWAPLSATSLQLTAGRRSQREGERKTERDSRKESGGTGGVGAWGLWDRVTWISLLQSDISKDLKSECLRAGVWLASAVHAWPTQDPGLHPQYSVNVCNGYTRRRSSRSPLATSEVLGQPGTQDTLLSSVLFLRGAVLDGKIRGERDRALPSPSQCLLMESALL